MQSIAEKESADPREEPLVFAILPWVLAALLGGFAVYGYYVVVISAGVL